VHFDSRVSVWAQSGPSDFCKKKVLSCQTGVEDCRYRDCFENITVCWHSVRSTRTVIRVFLCFYGSLYLLLLLLMLCNPTRLICHGRSISSLSWCKFLHFKLTTKIPTQGNWELFVATDPYVLCLGASSGILC